ncbi:exodeoxyribonuclease VII small subunit [Hahella sp. CCB-MM4]|uniref:exodeoxyribonuclease VII small subunit n=1 Tax=Hahella sp. (strain CCB-MM4) TaxID=1926491 RepID=UPI000B9C3981|nr:exodeoxyribonuclease VII small subunit [Hahella sp. CCB-MM4]OZG71972.1 exodeoxyribonuclease VII small subunit [Hahella sp. CCB-MM4]
MSKTPSTTSNFEDSLARLEELVNKLEQGELNLEDALVAFEEGVQLTRQCQQALKNAEQKVTQLADDQNSGAEKPFDEQNGE